MQIIELYIEDQKVDLFKDESVSITDSIQNVRDISKIFTAFSQQFNLPASKTNNKIFKHYYNFEIDNGFDARFKANAVIKLNGVDYKKGKIRLSSVDLKNNAPYSYKIIFFGNTIELKEVLAEDELDDLEFDDTLNFAYNSTNIQAMLETTTDDDLVVPLITHSKRFEIKNNHYRDLSNNDITFIELKPALKVKKIIEAIENTYPEITFSNDFFNREEFNKLYMWLHRNEGYISNSDEGGGIYTISNRFHRTTTSSPSWNLSSGTELRPLNANNPNIEYEISLNVNALGNPDPYTVIFRRTGGAILFQSSENTGNGVYAITLGADNTGTHDIEIVIQSENTFNITQTLSVTKLEFEDFDGGFETITTATYTADSDSITNEFVVGRQMPKMKVYDFLINLFKMFNLTVYKDGDILRVETLNDFYNSGGSYDITEYVDVNTSNISKLLQFKNMKFRYKSKKTVIVSKFDEIQGVKFSEESYGNDSWDGGTYNVEVDFEKMMYERLANGTTLTPVCQGTFLDTKLEPTIGKPLLLYCIPTDPNNYIDFHNGGTSTLTSYMRPSQVLNDNTGNTSLNFGLEMDEYLLETYGTNLYAYYYNSYIEGIFNKRARKFNISAYLPLQIILNYNLNDSFIINGKSYRINTIKTNLLTNKTDLELYNNTITVEELQQRINPKGEKTSNIFTTGKTDNSISITWAAVTGATAYSIYLDDVFIVGLIGGTTSYTYTGLKTNTTYKLGVRTEFPSYFSPTKEKFETTSLDGVLAENGDYLLTQQNENIIIE